MDKIEKGKFVEMAYELYEVGEDGKEELMLEMTKEKPERFVYGDEDNMLPAICQAIGGKTAGEAFRLHSHTGERLRRISGRTGKETVAQDV